MRSVIVIVTAAMVSGCIPSVDAPAYDAPPPIRRLPPVQDVQHDDDVPQDPGPTRRDDQEGYREPDAPRRDQDQPDEVSALPAPRPAWEARPVVADARDVPASTYLVRGGEGLQQVAERTGTGAEAIARANGLEPPFVIQIGQRLQIPAGRYHLVRPGETGIAIARAYGVEWSRIVEANALAEPYVLRVGQRVVIPGAAGSTPSRSERAAAFKLDIDDILTGGEPALASNQEPSAPAPTPRRILPSTAAIVAPARLRTGFAWPVDGRVVKRFGHGASGERNDGIKIAVPVATPIRATADGVVAYVGDGIAALGGLVIVRHGDRWTSVYGHASKLLVQRGQSVKRGQTLALSGETGFADRPEVHFELRRGRTPVDPVAQLPRL